MRRSNNNDNVESWLASNRALFARGNETSNPVPVLSPEEMENHANEAIEHNRVMNDIEANLARALAANRNVTYF